MSYLALLLMFKIGLTLALVSGPLLLAPRNFLMARAGVGAEAAPYLRLYGVAVTALLVGYAAGFVSLAAGAFPWGVVFMGIASNAGAAAALLATGLARRTPLMTAAFALIASALIAAALAPETAMRMAF